MLNPVKRFFHNQSINILLCTEERKREREALQTHHTGFRILEDSEGKHRTIRRGQHPQQPAFPRDVTVGKCNHGNRICPLAGSQRKEGPECSCILCPVTHTENHMVWLRGMHTLPNTLSCNRSPLDSHVSQNNMYVQHYICKHTRKVSRENMPFKCGSKDSSWTHLYPVKKEVSADRVPPSCDERGQPAGWWYSAASLLNVLTH